MEASGRIGIWLETHPAHPFLSWKGKQQKVANMITLLAQSHSYRASRKWLLGKSRPKTSRKWPKSTLYSPKESSTRASRKWLKATPYSPGKSLLRASRKWLKATPCSPYESPPRASRQWLNATLCLPK